MPRDHVEILDPMELAWSEADLPGFPEQTVQKTLSVDEETGASTRLLSLPAGSNATPAASAAGAEAFVVSGGLRLDDSQLGEYDYAHVPADAAASWETTERCRLLYMPDCDPVPGKETDASPSITDVAAMDWEQPQTDSFPDGAARKSLRHDPETGWTTWLLGVLPGWNETRIEVHPVAEEAYHLHPYSASHLQSQVIIIAISLVGFAVIKKPLSKLGHVPDVDLLVSPLVYYSGKVSVLGVTELYGAIDRAAIRFVRACYWVGSNPPLAAVRVSRYLPKPFRPSFAQDEPPADGGTPSRLYLRAGIGTTVLLLVAVITVLLVLAL